MMGQRSALAIIALLAACGAPPERPSEPYHDLGAHRAVERLEIVRSTDSEAYRPYFEHENPHVRARTARALGRVWHSNVVPALVEIAGRAGESPRVVAEALFALGQLHDVRAQDVAITLSVSESVAVRRAAVQALGKLRGPDDEAESQRAVRIATAVLALEDSDPGVRGEAGLALLWLDAKESVEPLVRAARAERDADARWRLVYALDRLDHPDTVEPLIAFVHDVHPWVRAFAAEGLSRPGNAEAVEALAWVLSDSDSHWTARVNALKSLRKLRQDGVGDGERIRELLVGRLHAEPHPLALEVAIEAIADGKSGLEIAFLEAILEKPNATRTERRAALRSLGRAAGERAIPILAKELTSDDPLLREAAVTGLAHGGSSALESVIQCLDDSDLRVRTAALTSLAALPVEEKWDWIRPALSDSDLAVRCTAVTALIDGKPLGWLKSIRDVLADSSAGRFWETRNTIIDALVAEGSKQSLDRVRELLSDRFVGVRYRAHNQLGADEPLPETEQFTIRRYRRLDPWNLVARGHPRLNLFTSRGTIVVELYLDDAPEHVSRIIDLARRGFYDGLLFHRVVPGFVVQGGDPRGDGWGDGGYHVPQEINPRPFLRGSVGMPTAGPDTGGCQLFIDHLPTPHLDGRYTVFGRVVLGMEVVDQIQVGDEILRATVDENQFWREQPATVH